MNLYLLTQSTNYGYDTYDSCVVCAPSPEEAKTYHPNGNKRWINNQWIYPDRPDIKWPDTSWATPECVTATWIGVANTETQLGVVISSFNAG